MDRLIGTTTKSKHIKEDGITTSFTTSVTKRYETLTITDIVFFLLKISFLVMLCLFLFRHSLGRAPLSFAEFLNALPTIGYDSNGVSYYESALEALNVRDIFEFSQSDTANLPIIGGLVSFLSTAIGIVVYVFGALVSSVQYFVDILSLIF